MIDNAKEYEKTLYVIDEAHFVTRFNDPQVAAQKLAQAWKDYSAPDEKEHYTAHKKGDFGDAFAASTSGLELVKYAYALDRDMARCFLKQDQAVIYHVQVVDPRTKERLAEPRIEITEKNAGDTFITVVAATTLREFIETQIPAYAYERPALYAVRTMLPGEIELYHGDHLEQIREILQGTAYDRFLPQIDRAIEDYELRQNAEKDLVM
jgi:hypothetical protein